MGAQRLIRPSDIATLAGVSPAAVANWRERQKETFPPQAGGTTGRPLYDYDEVVAWLHANGKSVRETTPTDELWTAMDSLRDDLNPEESGRLLLSLLVIRKIALGRDEVLNAWNQTVRIAGGSTRLRKDDVVQSVLLDAVVSAARDDEPVSDRLIDIGSVTSIDLQRLGALMTTVGRIAGTDLADAAAMVVTRVVRSHARKGGVSGAVASLPAQVLASLAVRENLVDPGTKAVAQSNARLAAALHRAVPAVFDLLSPVGKPVSLYDPATGIAETLLLANSALKRASLVGRDIDGDALRVAQQRAFLSDTPADFKVADTIAEDPWIDGEADAVFVEPPFGLKRTDGVAAWDRRWQYGTPDRQATDFAWVQDALAHLNPEGRAYVLLPGGTLFQSGAVARIRRALIAAGCVEAVIALPANLFTYTSIASYVWVLRGDGQRTDAVTLIDASSLDEKVSSATVTNTELLGEGGSILTPSRWLADLTARETDYGKVARDAERVLTTTLAQRVAPPDLPSTDFWGVRVLTIAELVKSGTVHGVRRGPVVPSGDQADVDCVIRPRDLVDGLGDQASAPSSVEPEKLTRPGDVLVSSTHGVRAVVDHIGGRAVSSQISILTPNANLLSDYLAAALMGEWNERFQMGTAIKHANIKDLEVPVPSLEDQQHIVAALQRAAAAKHAAAQIAAASDLLTSGLLSSVRYGADLAQGGRE